MKFNVEAVDTLIRANLVNMLQFDTYLANALEKGNNLLAMTFAIQLVQMYLIDDRFSSNVNESDLYNTVGYQNILIYTTLVENYVRIATVIFV